MFKVIEKNAIIDMHVAINIRKPHLHRKGKMKRGQNVLYGIFLHFFKTFNILL
jgi:hypothetical protein